MAHPPRALPRIVGRRARGWRHAQRRPAADPPPVRRTNPRRSAGADGRGPADSRTAGPPPPRRIVPATTSCGRPGNRSWARPSSTRSGTASCTMGSLPAASFPKSFPVSQRSPLRSSRACRARRRFGEPGRGGICEWPGDRVPPLPLASRRPLRERRVAAGASRSPHQAHLGQPRAREPEDRRDARSCERGCGPSRLCGPLARASRLDPPRHGGRRGRPHARLRPFARGTDWVWGRVRHVHGPSLPGTWLRQRRQHSPSSDARTRSRRPRSTAAWRGAPSCASRP